MRNVIVIMMAALLLIAVVPSAQTAEVQPTDDHTLGGDPDDPAYGWWTSIWAFIMDVIYFYHLDVI